MRHPRPSPTNRITRRLKHFIVHPLHRACQPWIYIHHTSQLHWRPNHQNLLCLRHRLRTLQRVRLHQQGSSTNPSLNCRQNVHPLPPTQVSQIRPHNHPNYPVTLIHHVRQHLLRGSTGKRRCLPHSLRHQSTNWNPLRQGRKLRRLRRRWQHSLQPQTSHRYRLLTCLPGRSICRWLQILETSTHTAKNLDWLQNFLFNSAQQMARISKHHHRRWISLRQSSARRRHISTLSTGNRQRHRQPCHCHCQWLRHSSHTNSHQQHPNFDAHCVPTAVSRSSSKRCETHYLPSRSQQKSQRKAIHHRKLALLLDPWLLFKPLQPWLWKT